MKTIVIGVMPQDLIRARAIAIAKGLMGQATEGRDAR